MIVDRVRIAGTDVDLSTVAYTIVSTHGRSTVTDGPTAGTVALTLVCPDSLPSVALSDTLEVVAGGVPRFVGKVASSKLSHVPGKGGRLAITGTGLVAELGLVPVTPADWPEETSEWRAWRILDAAGVEQLSTRGTLTVLATAPDADETSALALLTQLASDTGAAVFDVPYGFVMFSDLSGRAQTYIADVWETRTETWAGSSGTWSAASSPAVAEPVVIPATAIAWEPMLEQARADIVNRAVVEYGEPKATHVEEDTASQAVHGIRSVKVSTNLADEASAELRGEQIIGRQAQPRYQLRSVDILMDKLDETTREAVLWLCCGDRVVLTGLPDPSPVPSWLAVVEGWSETIALRWFNETDYEESHVLTLALSDPRASYATVQWGQVDPARTWTNVNPDRPWTDITTDADLAA